MWARVQLLQDDLHDLQMETSDIELLPRWLCPTYSSSLGPFSSSDDAELFVAFLHALCREIGGLGPSEAVQGHVGESREVQIGSCLEDSASLLLPSGMKRERWRDMIDDVIGRFELCQSLVSHLQVERLNLINSRHCQDDSCEATTTTSRALIQDTDHQLGAENKRLYLDLLHTLFSVLLHEQNEIPELSKKREQTQDIGPLVESLSSLVSAQPLLARQPLFHDIEQLTYLQQRCFEFHVRVLNNDLEFRQEGLLRRFELTLEALLCRLQPEQQRKVQVEVERVLQNAIVNLRISTYEVLYCVGDEVLENQRQVGLAELRNTGHSPAFVERGLSDGPA